MTSNQLAKILFTAVTVLMPSSGSPSLCQTSLLTREAHLEITLERKEGEDWRAADPGLVFLQDDQLRFRISSNFDGYLYVMNFNTSSEYILLFPREETGQLNRIQADKQYLVPATEGWLRITGPPGHEIVYWLVSPVELQNEAIHSKPSFVPLPPPPKAGNATSNLVPRCNDSIFKARGDCVDTSAGPKGIGTATDLPENLTSILGSRDVTFSRKENSTVTSSPAFLTGPVIFEFRLAHR